ncbi:UvrD-helicase domain-containing protein [Xenorhabdus siamensis]|uniref:UvrD-helicase domain-containing protein n=1 Tax=Xenorhabdus siamensis TaxID=3136254 RepID=UPI0030F3834C
MTKQLFIACAGAGKTTKIVKEAIELTNNNFKVLIITYTRSNQNELIHKFKELGGVRRELFIVKGWYSFILEDIVRPYQGCIFPNRITGINLNSSNPHIKNRYMISGRKEKNGNTYNPRHFFDAKGQAHTEFISKLACRIITESEADIASRIKSIYQRVYLDETQDLAGWDFDLLKHIVKAKEFEFHAVGDFRQTIYHTSSNPKKPSTSADKLAEYTKMGFEVKYMNDCWRSIDLICKLADTVHEGENYVPTISKIRPPKDIEHQGIFYISPNNIASYIELYQPMILRYSSASGKEYEQYSNLKTFGNAKGQTAAHVLIHPTESIINFLKGKKNVFAKNSTATVQNKLYVAITRARYSVAFIVDDKYFARDLWQPPKDY